MMKLFFLFLFSFCFIAFVSAQEVISDSLFQNGPDGEDIAKPVKATPLNPEKIAWEYMNPSIGNNQGKTPEMASFEDLLLRVKTGVAELYIVMGEFEIHSFVKAERRVKKNNLHQKAGH